MTDKNRNQTITLLHLSDMQFGEHHRFGVKTDTPDAALATLSACLLQDLDSLRQNHGLKPDILLLTGDLTEQGQKTEFEDFYRFADGLTSALELPRSQVVIVPGNHDIHWRKCRHYFENCKDDGEESRPPYWEKWFFYKRFFDLFYRDEPGIQFTEEEPWSWFEIESLKTVVAGLNSTMRESHRDHYGWTGESQLRWFKDKLENYRQQGWLRIAAIHHNIQRGAENDNENLRDADDLERMLDDSVHLLLHGHTHRGKLGWWNPGLPLLAAGSAALKKEIRPGDHPNQYQLIQIYPDKLLRWCRAFIPEQKIWKPDNRVHTAGETAYQETHVSFTNVQAALPAEQPKMPGDGISAGHRAPVRMHSDHDTFLARVEEICRLRNADAKIITRQGQHTDIPYLHVYAKEGEIVRSYPLGMAGQSVSLEMLDKFSQQVVNKYRSGDPLLISYLVYNGKRAPEELIRIAARQRIRLLSFIEYQELIDFRHYLERQTQKLRDDPVYPPDLYVPQQLRRQLGQDESMVEEALPRLQKWLEELKGRFVLVLGDFGTGKTFLLHELARTLGEAQNPGLIPILLEMRSLKKTNNLDRLAAQQLASDENLSFTPKKFRYMLEQGRIALLFDGFDELVQEEGSYARAAKYLDTLLEAAQGEQARIIVTSRTQHFLSDKQIKQNLLEKVDILARHRIVHLQTFSHAQIQTYLENRLKDKQAAAARYLLLDEIKDLLGLSENPRMLSFIADLPERDLREAKARDSVITTTKLYQLILDRWLDFEQERADDGRKDQLALRWRAVIKLALLLRGKTGCVEGLPLKGDSMPLDIFRPFVKTKDAMVLKALSTAFLDSLSDKDYTGLKEQTTALLSIDTTPELFRAMRECSKHETTKRWYGALYWLLSQSSAVESDRIPDALLLDQTWQTARNADGQASLDVFLGAAGKLSESIAVSCGGQSKRIVAEGKWAMFNLWKVLPDSLQIRVPENLPVLYFQGPQWQPREDLDNLRTVLPVLREKGLGNIVAVVSFLSEDDQKQSSSDLRQNLQAHAIDLIFLTLRDIQCFVCMKDARHLLLKRLLTEVDLLTVSPYRITGPTADNMFFGRENELREISQNMATASYAIIGGRRVGKTSVLTHLHRIRLPGIGFRTVFHSCATVRISKDFLSKIFSEWMETSVGNKPFVLLLDEADKLIPADRANDWAIFNTMRALVNSGRVQIALSGERVLREALRDPDSPLFNFANEILLGALDFRAVEELITRPMKQLGIELADEAKMVKRIYDITSGHSNIVQRLCRRLIIRLNERRIRRIQLDDVNAVINDPGFQRDDFLDTYWERASLLEKIISLLMADGGNIRTLSTIRKALENRCDLRPEAGEVDNALQQLVDLRSILRRNSKGYEFAVKAFPLVVAETMTLNDMLEVFAQKAR